MVSARSLGGALAQKFGRGESVGFDLVFKAQQFGFIAKGSGGGFGAREATAADGVILLLAFLGGIDHPRRDLIGAARCFDAAPAKDGDHVLLVVDNGDVGTVGQKTSLPALCGSLGQHLAAVITAHRCGQSALVGPSIQFAVSRYRAESLGELTVVTSPQPFLASRLWAERRYVVPLDPASFSPGRVGDRVVFDGSLLKAVADFLGPLEKGQKDVCTLANSSDPFPVDADYIEHSLAGLFTPDAKELAKLLPPSQVEMAR